MKPLTSKTRTELRCTATRSKRRACRFVYRVMDLSRLGEPDLFKYYASNITCPMDQEELVLRGVIPLLLNEAVERRKHGRECARLQDLALVEQKVRNLDR